MTRLQALDEHHKYALRQLAELPPNDVKKGKDSLRTRLDVISSTGSRSISNSRAKKAGISSSPINNRRNTPWLNAKYAGTITTSPSK